MEKRRLGDILIFILLLICIAGSTIGSFCLLYHYLHGAAETAGEADVAESDSEATDMGMDQPLMIRVHILGDNYKGQYHDHLVFSSEEGLVAELSGETRQCDPGERFSVTTEDLKQGDVVRISSGGERMAEGNAVGEEEQMETDDTVNKNRVEITVENLVRSQGTPSYGGSFSVYLEADGLLLVNELPLEQYLQKVVSSEMPSDYPLEAQKAQAVCARTYAWNCMKQKKNLENPADLDDSVAFQVYNNYSASDVSVEAVGATKGEILPLSEVLYYSTSVGSEGREDLGGETLFRKFLQEEPDPGQEYGSPWVRWETLVRSDEILDILQSEYDFSGTTLEILEVSKRQGDGQASVLLAGDRSSTVEIDGEYEIRRVLSPEAGSILLKDGTVIEEMELLPSAYFYLEPGEEAGTFQVFGGGYGHGQGMSQYGAAAMAKSGADYREILEYYYGESEFAHVENS